MRKSIQTVCVSFFILLWAPSFVWSKPAKELDAASMEALTLTQKLLENPNKRAEAIAANPQAQWIDQQAQSLAGSPENTQLIYELASDIFASLTKEAGGDVNKMIELVNKAKDDPKWFASKLTPAQREKLRSIAKKIPVGSSTGQTKP